MKISPFNESNLNTNQQNRNPSFGTALNPQRSSIVPKALMSKQSNKPPGIFKRFFQYIWGKSYKKPAETPLTNEHSKMVQEYAMRIERFSESLKKYDNEIKTKYRWNPSEH